MLSNEHGHYRFVSGEMILQLYEFTVRYGTHDQDLRTGAGGMIMTGTGAGVPVVLLREG